MWRDRFPLLRENHDLVYLDSAASTQKPESVIDALVDFYRSAYANVHRGVYPLSEGATELYETARKSLAQFFGAAPEETIITRSTTEGINLAANILFESILRKGEGVAATVAEHHSNFVVWQQLAKRHGMRFTVLPTLSDGSVDPAQVREAAETGAKVIAVSAVSNVLGGIAPVKELARAAHDGGALLVVDAAQAAAHIPIRFDEWGADFLAISGHKMYGPTGVGLLFGRYSLLEKLPPFLYGGDMIREVHVDITRFEDPPQRFEAGTPPFAEAIALAEAAAFIKSIGFDAIRAHERRVIDRAWDLLTAMEGAVIYGPPPERRTGLISFTMEGVHPHDIAGALGDRGICIRAGHHCAQPLHEHLGVPATARISFGCYNREGEIRKLADALQSVQRLFTGAA